MTHKNGDKTGDKERMKGDKADTMTNEKGDKRRQKGDKTDAMTNKKGGQDQRQEGMTRRTQ